MIRPLFRVTFAALVLALTGLLVLPAGARQTLAQPQTYQEAQNFKAGPTPFEPLMKFWYELDAVSDLVSIRPLTKTLLDREFTLVTIAKDPMTSPQDAIRSGKTIVLIANAVHGNETAGKEASQLVARDLVSGDARGYIIPASIAKVVPLLLDHRIQVHRFTEPTSMELEVYEAIGIQRNEYFQGHYLKAVTAVEKKTETVPVPAG